jgi:hypothetical protein
LEIGYFDKISDCTVTNRSSLVASITSLAGAHNGSLVVKNCGVNYDEEIKDYVLSNNGKMVRALKATVFV